MSLPKRVSRRSLYRTGGFKKGEEPRRMELIITSGISATVHCGVDKAKESALSSAANAAEEEIGFWSECGINEGDPVMDTSENSIIGTHTFCDLMGQAYGVFKSERGFTVRPVNRLATGDLPKRTPGLIYIVSVRLRDLQPIELDCSSFTYVN